MSGTASRGPPAPGSRGSSCGSATIGRIAPDRVGQKGRTTHLCYERGVRPRGVRDLGFAAAYRFGAVCPERGAGCALVLRETSTAAMNLLLAELAQSLPPKVHAVVALDQAG